MNKLDTNKIYYLGDLNEEQAGELFDWLRSENKSWNNRERFINYLCKNRVPLYFNGEEWIWCLDDESSATTNALELFYNLDNIQVSKGFKESDNKCNYELDFDFIQDVAMRIQNETKYEPYNWQKPMDIEQLSNALLRHAIEVKKGNFDDNGELGHLLAVAANAMFIYYQKKNKND